MIWYATAWSGTTVVTTNEDVLVRVTPPATWIAIGPLVAPAGRRAVIEESESTVNDVLAPFTLTPVAPAKPLPRMTMVVPAEPLAGMKDSRAGGGGACVVVCAVVVASVVVSGSVRVDVTVVVLSVNVVTIVSVTFAPAPPTPQRPVASPTAATATSPSQPFSLATVNRAYNDPREASRAAAETSGPVRGPAAARVTEPRQDASPPRNLCAYATSTTTGEVPAPEPAGPEPVPGIEPT